ncbi:fatty acid synthase subunit beta, fungi type [Rhizoctonia solani]|uniref:Fatty acid synthase subunit beta, fungi type n=1 Tax=Rhizoctonia solani TaxID=456999 RepID=A0A0K6G996_9AGAM|nr:fatty acid synthase subunit beta, fungi type [Rhizoctonia solani]
MFVDHYSPLCNIWCAQESHSLPHETWAGFLPCCPCPQRVGPVAVEHAKVAGEPSRDNVASGLAAVNYIGTPHASNHRVSSIVSTPYYVPKFPKNQSMSLRCRGFTGETSGRPLQRAMTVGALYPQRRGRWRRGRTFPHAQRYRSSTCRSLKAHCWRKPTLAEELAAKCCSPQRLARVCYSWPTSCVVRSCYRLAQGPRTQWPRPKQGSVLTTKGRFQHSHYLDGATEKVLAELGEQLWDAKELGIAVYGTDTGADLRELSTSISRSLCEQVLSLPVQWTKVTAFPDSATHAIDFGPGGLSGIGPLTARGLEGRGVRMVIVGEKGKNGAEIYDSTYDSTKPKPESSWSKKWTPRLVKNSDGKVQLDTPSSRLLGKPPIMVAGMTPTTVQAGFVSAVLSAGYHVELAGGGHYNPTTLREKVAQIQALIPPGVGLTVNALYLNQRQFGFQFPLWQEMRREGLPIEGFCVAAGIPSTEKAKEIVGGLRAAGIRHVSFKPGGLAVAPVGITREDFHQPILQTYAAIRQQDNISLVAGSGLGGSEDVWPYMSGEWSAQFGAQPMPFDGVLFASRVMVAKEAHTSKSVKDLVVAAPGVDDAKWEATYAKETGGILTVKSELGEPIHKVATRGVKLWKELDDTVFKLPKEKRAAWLAQNKDMVIEKLNKDFAKPWFAQKGDGRVVGDIGDMTHEEVVRRMVRLMYVEHQTRWIDRSLRNLVGDWLRRVEERFAGGDKLLDEFFNTYPLASEQLLAAEDKAYFLAIAQRPGQKPVPFIPVLDTSFEVSFKKDSLWVAEDIEAVFDQDPQRVCILQGPVAVKHVKVAGEPIKDILDNVESGLVSKLLENYYDGDDSKPEYVVKIGSAVDVGVLSSKEWFEWGNDSEPLEPGTTLIFKVKSEYEYKAKATYSSVGIQGHVYIRNQLKEPVKVATVSYSIDHAQGNPVLSYLLRHGEVQGDGNGYTLTSSAVSSSFIPPTTNEPYSKISGDFNSTHINPYFSNYAALPGTTTHGMWSGAATRKYVESVVAQGRPERVLQYDVSFVRIVLPGDELTVKLTHYDMRDGNLAIKVEASSQRGERVLSGTAEVAQAPTAYVFTGQGSQEPGMGMELYNNSPAARAVWEAADAHLLALYGISIEDIVKKNPKETTIHFGGIKGQDIRKRYMTMSYDTTDKDGNIKTLPLFADIHVRTPQYTFRHPNGILFATQFAQIALVVTEKAAFEDMKSKGLVQKDCAFAGHSLGEYSALASIADVLAISALVDVVYYRGIAMQRAVERGEHNRSNYAMCAVNPSRISKSFNDATLREGQQYVCTGELFALETLTNVLNYLKVKKIDIQQLTEQFTIEQVKEILEEIMTSCLDKAKEKHKAEGYIKLERGFATIPLPVMPFRTHLSKKINPLHLNPELLVDKYIPNLIAKPFEVTKQYAQIIYDQTSSPRLEKVLTNWDRDDWGSAEHRQKLAYTILVELLAYQFASPVRWIQTQDLLFSYYNFERLVEVGPGPTLTGMATRTPKAKYKAGDGAVSSFETVDAPTQTVVTTPAPVAAPVAAPVVTSPPGAAAASIPDEPLKAVDALRVIIAQKLKKKVDEVPISKAIKDLVGGKSTLQNEILGDLQVEFSSAPEKGEELPLDELGAALGVGYTGALGKHTNGLVSRMIDGKMPGGFNATTAKAHLNKTWGLGPARSDAALLLGVTMEPAKRLGSEAEAESWLDSVAAEYAKQAGIRLSSGGGAGGAAASGGIPQRDSRAGACAYDEEKDNAAALQAELDDIAKGHGDAYIQGIQPIFEPLKARHFNSSWNWVQQDALLMWYDMIFGRLTAVDREITSRCIAIMNRADATLIRYMQYYIDNCHPEKGETYALAKQFDQQLTDNCREVIGQPPLYRDVTFPTAPKTEVNKKGDIIYSEVVREGIRKLEAYVEEMASGDNIPGNVNIHKVHDDVIKLWNVVKSQPETSQDQKSCIKALYDGVVRSLRKGSEFSLKPTRPVAKTLTSLSADKIPLLHLKRKVGGNWEYSINLTGVYLDVLHEIATSGTSFKDKNPLLAGVGKGSIGVEILKGLLQGGARGIYHRCGSRDSSLTVVPFNQGSKQDVEALVDYVYSNLGLDLGYILPSAFPENGREIDGIDDRSELAHRAVLVNLLRLLGAAKNKKASRHIVTRPTQVILPLSPNHGLFGNDGLYSRIQDLAGDVVPTVEPGIVG